MRINIPSYAKTAARKALQQRARLPPSKRFGIDKQQARRLGINSGVERARQIIRSDSLSQQDAKRVSAFYNRFKNCRSPKCEGAINLWGGRRFGRSVSRQVRRR